MAAPTADKRPSWLIVLDVDGVVLRSHFLLEMSRQVGAVAYLRAWGLCVLFNTGRLPFRRLLDLVYRRFAGIKASDARSVFEAMALTPNTEQAAAALHEAGHKVVAVSSGVSDELLAGLAARLGLDAYAGIQVGRDGHGLLDGAVGGELAQPGGKAAVIERMHDRFGTDWAHTIVIADDRNNLDIMAKADASIGLRPNWPVRRQATYIADAGDMREALALVDGHITGEAPEPQEHETFRKCVHAAGCLVPFAARVSLVSTSVVLGAVAALYALSELWRVNGLSLPGFTWVTRRSVRQEELRRPSTGPVLLAAACLICLWCFPWPAAAAAIFVVALGDTAAAAAGRRWGRRRLWYSSAKTLEGVAACFLAGVAATCWLLPLPVSLIACAVGALVESLPLKDADNLAVPLSVAAAATWAAQVL